MEFMSRDSRNIDRSKTYVGVFLVCLSVLMMWGRGENPSLFWEVVRILLLGIGLLLYLWGRFFSRGKA